MDKDLQKLLGAGFAISGAITAGSAFFGAVDTAEKKGLTLISGLALVGLGVLFLSRLDDAAIKTQTLLS